jgi:NB-ARC domain
MSDATYDTAVEGTVQGLVQGSNNTLTINNYGGKAVERTVPFLAPPRRRAWIVGRDELLADLKAKALAADRDPAIALVQIPGVGKSELALALAYDGDLLGAFPDGVLWADIGKHPDVGLVLGKWASALGVTTEELAGLNVEGRCDEIRRRIGTSRMLLVVDDAWDPAIAQRFLLGGPGCLHIVTTRSSDVAWEFAEDTVVSVPELDDDAGFTLLETLAPEAVAEDPEAARALVRDLGGLPLGLVLTGRKLAKASSTKQPRRMRAALEQLRQKHGRLSLGESQVGGPRVRSLNASIELSVDGLSPESRRVLTALSVFRAKPGSFDEEAAVAVTGANVECLDELQDAGLLETYRPGRYTLQRLIAEYARAQLGDGAVALHERARDHFRQKLLGYEEALRDVAPYRRQYHYEEPEWQELKQSWLYHLARAGDPSTAEIALLDLYMRAFFWWGWLCEYPLCDRILAEWSDLLDAPDENDVLTATREFDAIYPKGYEKRGTTGWDRVEAALHQIRRGTALENGSRPAADEGHRHLKALTNIFLAQARQLLDPSDEAADRLLDEAYELCSLDEEDSWVLPWIRYARADLELDRGALADAFATLDDAFALALAAEPEDRDLELLACCQRVKGDAVWPSDRDAAFRDYCAAVYYTYVFEGFSKPPDFYSRELYESMTRVAARRVVELAKAGEDEAARRACEFLQGTWKDVFAAAEVEPPPFDAPLGTGQPDEVARALFPPDPGEAAEDAERRGRLSDAVERLGGQIGAPAGAAAIR